MQTKKRTFKDIFENVNIPEEMTFDEREKILKPMLEFTQKITPSKLFRYRECGERQFEAFDKDKIFAVNAKMFNDPYDCLPRYDRNLLYDSIKMGVSKDFMKQFRDALNAGMPMPEIFVSLYGEEKAKQIQEFIQKATDDDIDKNYSIYGIKPEEFLKRVDVILEDAESFLRRRTFIACFSETVKSVTMWSHYANSHKGFVLEHDLRNIVTKCTSCEKNDCDDRMFYSLYPIIYDRKRYDATAFMEIFLARQLGVNAKVPDVMFFNKGALYKSPQWKYEKEWRLFLDKKKSDYLQCLDIEVKPQAIYYGKDISEINKKILSEMAKKKCIKEYQMYIDTQSEKYDIKYRRV